MKSVFHRYITGIFLATSFLLGSLGTDILVHVATVNPAMKEYLPDSESKNKDTNSEDSKETTEKGIKEGSEYLSWDHTPDASLLFCTGILLTAYISYSPQSIFFPVPTPPPDLA